MFSIVQEKTIHFMQKDASIILSEENSLPWGARPYERTEFPKGGWCRSDYLEQGVFDKWQPKSILVNAKSFCIRDMVGRVHWFYVSKGECLDAILLTENKLQRVYFNMVVTQRLDNLFWSWPVVQRTFKQSLINNK